MSTYKHRYEARDDGLRFQDLVYQGNFKGMPPVPDGILGDKIMRSRAKSKVLEKVTKEDVLRDQFTLDELNDLNNYLAWNIWDVLVMRATEGVSGMIPRQEYEILAFMQEFYRWPEVLQMTTDEIGAKGVMEIGASARREIGTKVNCVHDWCIGAVGLGMGRCGLLALEAIQPRDFVRESNTILKFMQRVLWGKRQDGYILNSQDRYRCQIHEKDVIEKLGREIERLEHGSEAHDAFVRFGNVVDVREAQSFSTLAAEVGLGAGAIIQNAIGLNQAGEIASHCDTIWVDVVETVRTVYGFPTEVVQAEGAVDRYAADGFLQTNPFARPAAFLIDWLQSVSELSATALKTAVGVDLSGGFSPSRAADSQMIGRVHFPPSRPAPSSPHQAPTERAENAGVPRRRHQEEPHP